MVAKIALEEHFLAPSLEHYWLGTMADVPAPVREGLRARLMDFGELRLRAMDAGGVDKAVLSLAGPGVQIEPDARTAILRAAEANDFLAERIAARPDRFLGFAHLPMQDPAAAARELQRCVRDLAFRGAMVNGQTFGRYLDHPDYDVFWEKAQDLAAPIYIHPADPIRHPEAFADYDVLLRATWGWTVETGSHALRLIFGGVFERFPGACLIIGHMGETLPYLAWRLDSRAAFYAAKLRRRPSEYLRENVAITISGVYAVEPLACAIAVLGPERIMFAADYPFESSETACRFLDAAPIDDELRVAIASGNARRLLRLS